MRYNRKDPMPKNAQVVAKTPSAEKRAARLPAAAQSRPNASGPVTPHSTTRLIPFGSGLMATAPSVPLTAAINVPDEREKNGWQVSDQLSVMASLQLVVDRSTIEKTLDVSVGGHGVLSGVSLGLDASYSKTVRVSQYSISFLVVIHVITQSRRLKTFELSTLANALLSTDPDGFSSAYGDYFCSEKQYGGVLAAVGRYATNSTVLSEQIKASLEANAIMFGAWGDVKSLITTIHSKDQFDFVIRTEGVVQDIPHRNHLASPDAFIKLCNDWIAKATANKVIPVRDYFTPYTAIPGIKPKPPFSDLGDFKKLLKVRNEAQDLLQSVLDIRANPDSFEEPPNEQFLTEIRKYAAQFVDSCEDKLDEVARDPMRNIEVPELQVIPLPKQNRYSKDAIHAHLVRGYKIKVTLEADIEGAEKILLLRSKPYEVFIREAKLWYCIPPTLDDPRPKNVTTDKAPSVGTLWLWGVQFTYDNRGEAVHRTNGIKGRIEVIL